MSTMSIADLAARIKSTYNLQQIALQRLVTCFYLEDDPGFGLTRRLIRSEVGQTRDLWRLWLGGQVALWDQPNTWRDPRTLVDGHSPESRRPLSWVLDHLHEWDGIDPERVELIRVLLPLLV